MDGDRFRMDTDNQAPRSTQRGANFNDTYAVSVVHPSMGKRNEYSAKAGGVNWDNA